MADGQLRRADTGKTGAFDVDLIITEHFLLLQFSRIKAGEKLKDLSIANSKIQVIYGRLARNKQNSIYTVILIILTYLSMLTTSITPHQKDALSRQSQQKVITDMAQSICIHVKARTGNK